MLIEQISIRGFKSYGHNIQTVKLDTTTGKLCLLVGKNGAGKSALINAFEYASFGRSRGRMKTLASNSSLVNRINRELLTDIKFHALGKYVEITRGINPNIFKLKIDGDEVKDDISKCNAIIEEHVGMDMLSFRSFISLSVNDFKNFIALTSSEKQLLLDKLFNLESVTQMGAIAKELNRLNAKDLASNAHEIKALELSIIKIEDSINRTRQSLLPVVDNSESIIELTAKLKEYEPVFFELKNKLEIISKKETQLMDGFKECKKLFDLINIDLGTVKSEIELFDANKCPTCKTTFDTDHFKDLRIDLADRHEQLLKVKQTIVDDNTALKSKKTRLDVISKDSNKSYSKVVGDVTQIKRKLSLLKKEEVKAPAVDLSEFELTIDNSKFIIDEITERSTFLEEKAKCYSELQNLFGPDGIKKIIISSIIEPLNSFVQESMELIDLPFSIKIDESFDVSITQRYDVIDHDTLSTGENRLVNIAILIAYLKLIRVKKEINVLFLDEIFSSIDVDGIDILLELLGKFAKESNLNIFVVHHSIISERHFDRIIKLEKNTFSNIIEEK